MTSAGRPSGAMVWAMVKVLPEPVTPIRVWNCLPSLAAWTSLSMAGLVALGLVGGDDLKFGHDYLASS